jgi:hypothetical protein
MFLESITVGEDLIRDEEIIFKAQGWEEKL